MNRRTIESGHFPVQGSGKDPGTPWFLGVYVEGSDDPVFRKPLDACLPEGNPEGWRIAVELGGDERHVHVQATVTSDVQQRCFLALECEFPAQSECWFFDGVVDKPEIYRQSPHDPDAWFAPGIARQSIPMVSFADKDGLHIAVNGSPSLYEDACSQMFDPSNGRISLRSGDDGATPGKRPSPEDVEQLQVNGAGTQRFSPGRVLPLYHDVGPGCSHHFECVLFSVPEANLASLRRGVYRAVAKAFANEESTGLWGDLAFTTAWMNLRVNEMGHSRFWVVPAAEYSNRQYNRDAFWIAMMLEPGMDRECFLQELARLDAEAEYPLLTMIWSRRILGSTPGEYREKLQACLDVILEKVVDNEYRAFRPEDGRHDFQYWQDSIAFDRSDLITYNQGLLALALRVADAFGLNLHGASAREATDRYRDLFQEGRGYFPVSRLKPDLLGPDCLIPDLLSQLYFDEAILPATSVREHFLSMNRLSLTGYGYKILGRSDGRYPDLEEMSIDGYVSEAQKADFEVGDYQRGGSWFLYDCTFLLDAILHGIQEAHPLLFWRVRMELDAHGTTFEYLHTRTGKPHKSNMGWNVAIYAILRQAKKLGKVSNALLEQIEAGRF